MQLQACMDQNSMCNTDQWTGTIVDNSASVNADGSMSRYGNVTANTFISDRIKALLSVVIRVL